MFSLHLPRSVYEHLPKAYLLVSLVLAFSNLSEIRWLAVIALVLAAGVTRTRRRAYREAQRRAAMHRRIAARYPKARAEHAKWDSESSVSAT